MTTQTDVTVIEVTASSPSPSQHGAGGWDVDVVVELSDGTSLDGEVTLLPDAQDGSPTAWGGPDHWISGDLLRRLPAVAGTLSQIEAAAREEIEGSGIAPAKATAY